MRGLLVLVSSILFVDALVFVALTPLVPGYAEEFGLSKTGAGMLVAAYGLGAIVGGIPGGLLAMRAGPKTAVLAGLVVLAVASVVFALAQDQWTLGISRVVQGLASAATWAGGLAWLTVATPRERRGAVIGTALAAAITGAIIGPVVGGVADVVGTRESFLVVAGAVGVMTVVGWRYPGAPPEEHAAGAVQRAVRDPGYLGGLWLVFLVEFLFSMLVLLVPLALDDNGFTALAIGSVFAVAGVIEVVLNPFVGRASDRYGRLRPLRVALGVAALVTIGLASADSSAALVVLALGASLGFGAIYTPSMALVADRSEAVGLAQGLGFGLMNTCWALGLLTGPILAGAIAETAGDHVAYLVAAGLVLTTLAASFTVRRAAA